MTTESDPELSEESREQLEKALLSAYPEPDQLKKLVDLELKADLNVIAPDNTTYDITIYYLIKWAGGKGKMKDLVSAAYKTIPDNHLLRSYVNTYFPALIREFGPSATVGVPSGSKDLDRLFVSGSLSTLAIVIGLALDLVRNNIMTLAACQSSLFSVRSPHFSSLSSLNPGETHRFDRKMSKNRDVESYSDRLLKRTNNAPLEMAYFAPSLLIIIGFANRDRIAKFWEIITFSTVQTTVTATPDDTISSKETPASSPTVEQPSAVPGSGCEPAITSNKPSTNGTPPEVVFDGNRFSVFFSSFQDWQYVQIDFGCTINLAAIRRYMSRSEGMPSSRRQQGEGFSYSLDGKKWIALTANDTTGWEKYDNMVIIITHGNRSLMVGRIG